jgi:hypothetical protein
MFISKKNCNKPYTTNQKKKQLKKKNKIHEIKKKGKKPYWKNIGFLFSTFNHSRFLQEGMQGGSTRFFNK